jgi:tetratricopeptide (TPR) repeat protein
VATEQHPGSRRAFIWLAAIVLVTFGVYARSLWNGYTYDDAVFVQAPTTQGQTNYMVAELQPLPRYFTSYYGEGSQGFGRGLRPFTVLSYALVHRAFRVQDEGSTSGWRCPAGPHHGVNVFLHCVSVWLVYLFVAMFLGKGLPALAAAAVFGLHALRSDPVISLVGRAEIMAFMFGCASALVYVAALRRQRIRRWLLLGSVALLLFLAIGSKEGAVAWAVFLPLTVMALRWQDARQGLPDFKGQVVPILVGIVPPVVVFLLLWLRLQAQLDADPKHLEFVVSRDANPLFHAPLVPERLGSALMILAYGLYKVLCPFHLVCDYGAVVFDLVHVLWDYRFLAAFVVLLAVLVAGLVWAERQPLLFLAMAVFFGFSFLTSNIPMKVETIFGERLYYTPAMSLSLCVAWGVARLPARLRVVGGLVLLAWLLTCSVLIVQRGVDWTSNDTLFATDARKQPRSLSMQMAMATRYKREGNTARWKDTLEAALRLDPKSPHALTEMGAFFFSQGKPREAEKWLHRALDPEHPDRDDYDAMAYGMLATIYLQRRQLDRAEEYFKKAIAGDPFDPRGWMNLARLYLDTGRRAAARNQYRQMVQQISQFRPAWEQLLAMAYEDRDEAEVQRLLEKAEHDMPGAAFLVVHRGLQAFRHGRMQEAVEHFARGLRREEQLAQWQPWHAYAVALDRIGQRGTALQEIAVFLDPHNARRLPPAAVAAFRELDVQLRRGR